MLAGYMVHFSAETIFQCSESSENLLMLGLLHLVFCIQSTYNKYLCPFILHTIVG